MDAEGAAYFNDVEGIEAKVVGEVGSGGDLHQRAISGGREDATKLHTKDAGWAAQRQRCNACGVRRERE